MNTDPIPPVPQTGISPPTLPPDQERRLLDQRRPTDHTDPFAADPDSVVQRWGKLALRRTEPHPHDYLALGDRCAQLTLAPERRLQMYYVGKTLLAYRRAEELANGHLDEPELARRAYSDYVRWVLRVARIAPSRRNIAVALWAAAEAQETGWHIPDLDGDVQLLTLWYISPPQKMPLRSEPPDADESSHSSRREVSEATYLAPEESPTLRDMGAGVESVLSQERLAIPEQTHTVHSGALQEAIEESASSPAHTPILSAQVLTTQRIKHGDFDFGDRIGGRYEVAQVVRGGMGIVYLCYDHEERCSVVLKTFQRRFLTDENTIARFTKEAKTWIEMEKHPHIVQARRVQKFGGRPHIILEHVAGPEGLGPDLRSWIRHRRTDVPTALDFALQIALGMHHATRRVRGLVHRDLKPGNILVRHDGLVKVTDFGLVRTFEGSDVPIEDADQDVTDHLTRVGALVGTPAYMSPEQCRAAPVDMRSDIYTFGCVLYEMLTWQRVFSAKTRTEWVHAHVHHAPAFPEAFSHIPQDVQAFVLSCLAKSPDDRPQDWAQVVEQVTALYTQIVGQAPRWSLEHEDATLEMREWMDKAYSLTELGYADEALQVYNQVLEHAPNSAWVWARKGRTLRILGRYEDALEAYDRALQLNPRFAWAWTGKGQVLEQLGQLERALAAHQTATELQPDNVWAWYNLAETHYTLQDYSAAMKMLDRALQADPHHAESWAKRGQVLRALGRYPEALNAYNRALELNPPYAWAWNGKGLTLKAMGRYEEALEAFEQATRYQPREVWHWYNQAELLVEIERYRDALAPTLQATRIAPDHAYSWAKLGQVLRYLERYDEALDAYNQALRLKPDYAWALNGRGIVLERLERYNEALEMYRQAAFVAPDDVWHWYNLGNLLALQGAYKEAASLLTRAIQVSPEHARSWARLGNVYRHLARWEDALRYLKQAVTLAPDYAWAWNERGIVLEAVGRAEEAVEAYRNAALAAANSTANSALYWYNLGDALVSLGRHTEALMALHSALEVDPRYVRAWAKQGQALRRLGRHEEALASYSRAVELAPEYAWAWNGRGLALSALGRHEEALASFRKASDWQPEDVWFWYNQADELVVLGRYEEALLPLERALQLDPQHAESWAKRGQVLRHLHRYEEALAAYDRALQINTHYAWAWNGRGLVLEALGRREEALLSYERATAEDPQGVWYWLNQVDPLLALGRLQQALRVVDRVLALSPANATAWARRGRILRHMERYEEALMAYRQAVNHAPDHGWAWNGTGRVYAALGRWQEALECYQKATTTISHSAWIWHNLGEALMQLGRWQEAVQAFDRALELDPSHEPSRQKRTYARRHLKPGEE